MHPNCPQCGLQFSRDPGYFFGAMFFSYGFGVLCAIPTAVLMVASRVAPMWIGLTVAVQLAVLSPLLFRYSRICWMHLDQWIDPR